MFIISRHIFFSQALRLCFCISFVDIFQLDAWCIFSFDLRSLLIIIFNIELVRRRLLWGTMKVKIKLLNYELAYSLAERFRSFSSELLPVVFNVVNRTWYSFNSSILLLLIIIALI